MGLRKLVILVFLVIATMHSSATVFSPTGAWQTTLSAKQINDVSEFRSINLYYTTCKSFSGFLLLSDLVNYVHFDHNSYSRKISLFGSSDISVFLKSTSYFKGPEKYDYVPLTSYSYSFFCKLQL
jgi:hypothetical protein